MPQELFYYSPTNQIIESRNVRKQIIEAIQNEDTKNYYNNILTAYFEFSITATLDLNFKSDDGKWNSLVYETVPPEGEYLDAFVSNPNYIREKIEQMLIVKWV
ncbi:hypothetical protein ENUP19_0361G0056 [Entamoeba nuttalli]|uniref:Uncharacterized protein n=1 Tax=Entamoeba nuttalli TaxID=412467 RepID=A0ABQ0DYE9_9EUKA